MKNLKNLITRVLLGMASLFILTPEVWGCYFFSKNSNARSERHEQAFLYHDGENAHMVIKSLFRGKKGLSDMAWVIPFPSVPSKYIEVKGPFFLEMNSLIPNHRNESRKGSGKDATELSGGLGSFKNIKVHNAIQLEQYLIQPIEILKDGSDLELKTWLKNNKFDFAHHPIQKKYLKKGSSFLALKMQMNAPGIEIFESRPIHIVYKSNELSFPLINMHKGSKLDLDLYVFSTKELKKDLSSFSLNRQSFVEYTNTGNYPFIDEIIGKKNGFITYYKSEGISLDTKPLKDLKEDPTFLLTELYINN